MYTVYTPYIHRGLWPTLLIASDNAVALPVSLITDYGHTRAEDALNVCGHLPPP
jgi:hypothetical protein